MYLRLLTRNALDMEVCSEGHSLRFNHIVTTCRHAVQLSLTAKDGKLLLPLVLSLLFYDNICQNQVHEDKIFDSMFIRLHYSTLLPSQRFFKDVSLTNI